MKTIRLTDKDIHKEHLLLVNRRYAIRPAYLENMKSMIAADDNSDIYLSPKAGAMLSQLIKACGAEYEEALIRVPDGLYQISGNNVDGVIITVCRQEAI